MFFWFFCLGFKRGADSLVDAQAIRDSAAGKILFERARLWGSIGFLISSIGMGLLVKHLGISAILYFGLLVLLSILVVAALLRPSLGAHAGTHHSEGSPSGFFSTAVKSTSFILLLLTMLFNSASHSAYYTYFSLYLNHLDWGAIEIASCWNIGVVAEILIFLVFRRLNKRISLARILQISMVFTALRWAILFATDNTIVILCSQTLHGFSYGTCYLASMKLVHDILPNSIRDRGLGWLTAVGLGLGSILGRLLFGYLAQSFANYSELPTLFLISSGIALLGVVASLGIKSNSCET
jgi:PPP family 3-phenylpropionic acid transporter